MTYSDREFGASQSDYPKEQQMSDIVERLRKLASIYADPDIDGALWKERDLLTEAAAEIERLRAGRVAVDEMERRKDAAYLERNQVVAALACAFPSGIARTAIEGWSDDWHGCVYIDLPNGQASWHYHDSHAYLFAHLPPYDGKWDGHTTEEKYIRLAALRGRALKGGAASEAIISECQHKWSEWLLVGRHVERKCQKCGTEQYDD